MLVMASGRFDLTRVATAQSDKTARKHALKLQKTAFDSLAEVGNAQHAHCVTLLMLCATCYMEHAACFMLLTHDVHL